MFLTKSNGMIIGPIASLLGMCMNGIFYVLNQIGIPNIGLSITIMTILIYMAMLPLTIKQQKFSKLQRKMQPELNKINKKYENRKDPESMQRQQDEIKEVYGKYGVSATGSCVQLIIQMPILLALYRVFYNIPAYVPMVKQAFFPLVDKLIEADASGSYLQATNAAYQEFAANKTADSNSTGYSSTVGEAGTDYAASGNKTSAGRPGFFSNESATATYKADGTDQSATYPKPVIQVGATKLQVTKVWQDEDGNELAADEHPDSVTVTLKQDGTATNNTLTLSAENNWTGTFDNLLTSRNDCAGLLAA